jgi:hypothetical protein
MSCKQAKQATTTAERVGSRSRWSNPSPRYWRRHLAGILAYRPGRDLRDKSLRFVNPQLRSEHAP